MFERITKYGESLARWIAAGSPVRSESEIARLLAEHCQPCDKYVGGACSSCGCRVNSDPRGWRNKLAMATESCPENKWGAGAAVESSRRLSVGFVLPVLQNGGVEQWHVSMCRALSRHPGVRVSGVACTADVNGVADSVAAELASVTTIVGSADSPHVRRVSGGPEAVAVVGRASDVLVVWSIAGHVLDACRAAEKPLIGVSHGEGDWWMREAAPHVLHWVAVSEAARPPIPSADVVTINNGVDVERCWPTLSREAVRDAAGIPRGARLAVSIGRLSPEKRLHLLAGALDRLPPDCWLWLVGDGREAERIRTAAGRAVDRLVISPARRDIGSILGAADCFAFVSQSEGYGLAPVEALAAGVPLAATPVGVLPSLGDCAEWIPHNPTLGQVADAILAAFARDRVKVEATRALVVAEHSAAAMAGRWAEMLCGVVRPNTHAPR